MQIALALSSG